MTTTGYACDVDDEWVKKVPGLPIDEDVITPVVPSKNETEMPPKDETEVPPKDETVVPSKNETEVPPKDEIEVPPKDETEVPPKEKPPGPKHTIIDMTEEEENWLQENVIKSRKLKLLFRN